MSKPAKLTKAFTAAFERVGKENFGPSHKVQLDALHEIVDELKAGGIFDARIVSVRVPMPETDGFKAKKASAFAPVLEITQKTSGIGETFFIDFGHESFGSGKTLKLSTGPEKKPVGKAAGYSMQFDNERDELLQEVGTLLSNKVNAAEVSTSAVSYTSSTLKIVNGTVVRMKPKK